MVACYVSFWVINETIWLIDNVMACVDESPRQIKFFVAVEKIAPVTPNRITSRSTDDARSTQKGRNPAALVEAAMPGPWHVPSSSSACFVLNPERNHCRPR
jgi:hypothetical protein